MGHFENLPRERGGERENNGQEETDRRQEEKAAGDRNFSTLTREEIERGIFHKKSFF